MADDSGNSVMVTLWGKFAEETQVAVGDVLAVSSAKASSVINP